MSWFPRRRKKRRHSDWDFFDGYPPNLRMRRLADGVWEVRQATEEEMREFLACEAAFVSGPARSGGAPNLDKSLPTDAESDSAADLPAKD